MIREWLSKVGRDAAVKALEEAKSDHEVVLRELNSTKAELRRTKDQLEDVKLKKKIEEEDLKHLTKIKLEQTEIEFQKRVMAIEKQKDSEVMSLKQGYADKMQVRLEKETESIKEMYGQILQRLPDVNVRMRV